MPKTDLPDLDFNRLFQDGLRTLERLAAPAWTDFNTHDPGITILEQYCYALSDFAYRCAFPLPDLLGSDGRDPYAGLPRAARLLTTRPVTLLDLRKLVVDVRGVRNAWIEPVEQPETPLWYTRAAVPADGNPGHGLVALDPAAEASSEPIRLRGVYRVLIAPSEVLGVDGGEVVREVAARLHANRPLAIDFAAIDVLPKQPVAVEARIEIAPEASPEDVCLAIFGTLARQVAPPVRFHTLAERLACGVSVEEIFDGPALTQGFVDAGELVRLERQSALRVSDFLHALIDVEGVRMVRQLVLRTGERVADWWLNLDPRRTPVFDLERSRLTLVRREIPVGVDHESVRQRFAEAQASAAYRPAAPGEIEFSLPAGRDRRVGRHYPAQHHFPALYALGERGLPPEATDLRRAQLRQLQAYLLVFDQLLANQCAQLAQLGDLLGFAGAGAGSCRQTYFAGEIDDPALGVDEIWLRRDARQRRERLEQIVEKPAVAEDAGEQVDWSRRNRFLDHLLARFGEQLPDPERFDDSRPTAATSLSGSAVAEVLAQRKREWLQRGPELAAARGTGGNLLASSTEVDDRAGDDPISAADPCSGVERRLQLRLGLSPDTPDERFYLVEHLLLRPSAGDQRQHPALFADARSADPYSLQVSLILPAWPERFREGCGFRRYLEQVAREELPAQLALDLRWLDRGEMETFAAAYRRWRSSQSELRAMSDQKTLDAAPDGERKQRLSFALRDARDRLIDLIGIGRSYPLADTPVLFPEWVAWGERGRVTVVASQRDVDYELLDTVGDELRPLEPRVKRSGDGGDLQLLTPPIDRDRRFRIRASGRLQVDLAQAIAIRVGLDTGLPASMLDGDPLDPASLPVQPADPRIVDFGRSVRVAVDSSQPGVEYALVQLRASRTGADHIAADPLTGTQSALEVISTGSVFGDSQTITLHTRPVREDVDLRVLAIRPLAVGVPPHKELLDAVLPLRVRASPALPLLIGQSVIAWRGGTTVTISGAQASTEYQVFVRSIADSEFVRDGSDPTSLEIAGMPALRVRQPANPALDAVAVGAARPGSGGDLVLPVTGLEEDGVVLVRAVKTHRRSGERPPIASSVQLAQALVVLVRPGTAAAFPLRFAARAPDSGPAGLRQGVSYEISHGQPGVFYHFAPAAGGLDLGLPVYFHKSGKGIDGLQIEIDFVVAGDVPTPPEWDCPIDLAASAPLSVRAVKAQTGVEERFAMSVGELFS